MQNIGKKASILIWSIFLSMALFISFVSISNWIRKNLQNNTNFIENIETNNKINTTIIENSSGAIPLGNNQKLEIEDESKIIMNLKEEEEIEIKTQNDNQIVTIKIINWSPIEYKTGGEKWILVNRDEDKEKMITLIWDTLNIKNLWWYSQIELSLHDWEKFEKSYKKYTIQREYTNRKVIKEKWEIKLD